MGPPTRKAITAEPTRVQGRAGGSIAARRRRRTKYTWFPTLGTAGAPGIAGDDDYSGLTFTLLTPLNGSSAIATGPLTFDLPQDDITVVNPLAPLSTIIGNEWVLERLVGKAFISLRDINAEGPPAVLVGLGFFVARATGEGASAGLFPIGGDTTAGQIQNYAPLTTENIREPWLWRRTWIFGNTAQTIEHSSFPRNTAGYGSIQDGPHIDAKSKRRIGQDDRIWAVIQAKTVPNGEGFTQAPVIDAYVDFRILGRLARPHNKSAF